MAEGWVKPGYFKGHLRRLRQRYITALPDLIILLHIPCPFAKQLESMIKTKFEKSRMIGEGGRRSEWIQCNTEKLKDLIQSFTNELKKLDEADCEAVVVQEKVLPVASKKRKTSSMDSECKTSQEFLAKKSRETPKALNTSSMPAQMLDDQKDSQEQVKPPGNKPHEDHLYSMDPRAQEVFVDYVCALEPLHQKILTQSFLRPFVSFLLRVPVEAPDGKHNPFTISLKEATILYEINAEDFVRLIVGRADSSSKAEFKFRHDFITNGKGSPHYKKNATRATYFFYMTPTCFAKASMIYQGKKSKQIRQYFELVNRALMDRVGESIWKRLKIENPELS